MSSSYSSTPELTTDENHFISTQKKLRRTQDLFQVVSNSIIEIDVKPSKMQRSVRACRNLFLPRIVDAQNAIPLPQSSSIPKRDSMLKRKRVLKLVQRKIEAKSLSCKKYKRLPTTKVGLNTVPEDPKPDKKQILSIDIHNNDAHNKVHDFRKQLYVPLIPFEKMKLPNNNIRLQELPTNTDKSNSLIENTSANKLPTSNNLGITSDFKRPCKVILERLPLEMFEQNTGMSKSASFNEGSYDQMNHFTPSVTSSPYSSPVLSNSVRKKQSTSLRIIIEDVPELSRSADENNDSRTFSSTLSKQQNGIFTMGKVDESHITFRRRKPTVESKVQTEDASFIETLIPDIVKSSENTELSLVNDSNSSNTSVNVTFDFQKSQDFVLKSSLKRANKNDISNGVARRVTFSNTSTLFIDDDSVLGSSQKSPGTPIPTVFDKKSKFNKHTGIVQTAYYTKTASKTTFRLSSPMKPLFGTPKRLLHENSHILQKSKVKKMPNFAALHKKMFDKMLDIEQHELQKRKRAELLLSGRKPSSGNLSSSELSTPKSLNRLTESFILLQYSSDASLKQRISDTSVSQPKVKLVNNGLKSTGASLRQKRSDESVPKVKANVVNGHARFGCKSKADNGVAKQEAMAVAGRKLLRPLKYTSDKKRIEIEGVRSNRRFELWMKSRQTK